MSVESMKKLLREIDQEEKAKQSTARIPHYQRVLKFLEDDIATGMTLRQLVKVYDLPARESGLHSLVKTYRPDYYEEFLEWYERQMADEIAYKVAEQVDRQKGKRKCG